ncbi:hypothetical protein ACQ4WX_04980 [Streptomyces lasalocidi]
MNAGNTRFAELWATGEVAAHREDHKTIDHPRWARSRWTATS